MKILVINGPNLNMLGKRNKAIYGNKTLAGLETILKNQGKKLGVEVVTFQSNGEGQMIDFIQENYSRAHGIIINPGALTHYGFSLRDALEDTSLPIIEVHISNIYARKEFWRAESVIAPIARGQIAGLGFHGYIAALQIMAEKPKGKR
jgi:3-dehydroquinate dehydratase-2